MFLKPMLFDEVSVYFPLSFRVSNFGYPMLLSKLNKCFPETELSGKSSSLSSGCFLLSILLNISYGVFRAFIKSKYA